MNNTEALFNYSGGYAGYGMAPIKQVTTQDVINQLLPQFIWKTELMALSFLIVMCYLEYYTMSMQKEHKKAGTSMKNKDHILCWISNIFFLASVAYALTFVSYIFGWF